MGKRVSSEDRTGSLPLPEMGCRGVRGVMGRHTIFFLSSQEMQKLEMDERTLQISIPMTSQGWHVEGL